MRVLLLVATLITSLFTVPGLAADWLYLTYPGDTLIGIGKQYLKNPRDWPKVQVANTLADPRKLPANTRIKIPVQLLKVTPAPVTVTAVTGNVRFRSASGSYQRLRAGDQLVGGETVITGPRSSSAFRFADGTSLTQQDSSRMSFGRLAAYGKTGMVSTELSLESGRLEAHAAKQLAPVGGFRVVTPVAVAGLRGTDFRLNLAEDGSALRNEVLEGTVAVSAQGRSVSVAGGFGSVTEKGKPPAPPRPLLPAPSADGLPARILRLPLGFIWQPVPGAQRYRVQVAADPEFAQVLTDDMTTEPAFIWPDDLPDGHYRLRLRAIDDVGLEGRNLDHAFELDARPLPPMPTSPALGERLYRQDIRFAWSAAVGATGYLLQIAPTPEFSSGVIERRLPAMLQHEETLPEGTWHWRITSLDETGQAHDWSPHRAFLVQLLPGAPTGGEAQVSPGQVSFAWSPTKGAARYAFELGGDAALSNPSIKQETEQTTLEQKLEPGKYFWRVRGLEADGQAGAWSTSSPVILPPKQPAGLALQVQDDKLVATWQGEAQSFIVELSADAGFGKPIAQIQATETKASLEKPAPGTYWVRVKGVGAEGVQGPASEAASIEIQRPPCLWWLMLPLLPAL